MLNKTIEVKKPYGYYELSKEDVYRYTDVILRSIIKAEIELGKDGTMDAEYYLPKFLYDYMMIFCDVDEYMEDSAIEKICLNFDNKLKYGQIQLHRKRKEKDKKSFYLPYELIPYDNIRTFKCNTINNLLEAHRYMHILILNEKEEELIDAISDMIIANFKSHKKRFVAFGRSLKMYFGIRVK